MSGFGPPILNSSIRSWNWPWISPHTVTGHFYRTCVSALAAEGWGFEHIRLVGHWTRPGELPAPVIPSQLGAHDGWHASKEQRSQCSMMFRFVEEQGRRRRSTVSVGMLTFSQSL